MKKPVFLLFLSFFLLVAVSFSTTFQITQNVIVNLTGTTLTTFNETQTSGEYEDFNYSFPAEGDYIFYIRIPKNSNVLSATLNISGFYECLECGICSYDPGTGPDCTCPPPGSGGSCPGGCSACSYTPSCPTCSCQSPYAGGGISSCNPCSYTPDCPSCSCTWPYTGGGVSDYVCTYACSYSATFTGSKTVSSPTRYTNWACSASISGTFTPAACEAGFASLTAYGEARLLADGSMVRNVVGYTPEGGVFTCVHDACPLAGCTDCSKLTSCSVTSSAYSCSPGEVLECSLHQCYEYEFIDTACSVGGRSIWITCDYSCHVSWSYNRECVSSTPCGAVCCKSGETQTCDSGTCSCIACNDCYYTPTPSENCVCPSPGSGGGCASCNSCVYTPGTGPDCTCPPPGSGGSCPGGCEICEYTPDLPSCSCVSPYTGGGCIDYGQPKDPYIDSTNNGIIEWSYTGWFNETVSPKKVDLNPSEINNWLKTCTPDSNGNCLLPIKVHSAHKGKIRINAINITYDFNVSSIYTLDDNEGKYFWNQTSNIIAGEEYKKHYKAYTSSSPVDITISGYYLLNQTATDCWVNEMHYTPTGTPLYCPISFTISRGESVYHNISDAPLSVPVTKVEGSRIQDMSKTTFAGGYAYAVIPINVTNVQDTGETLYNIIVNLSSCPSGWTCDRSSWIVSSLAENSWNVTNATMYKYNVITSTETLTQTSNESRVRVRWNLTDIWKNTDTISYIWVNKTYTLPSDCDDVEVWINGTEYTDSDLVTISNCVVNVTWNQSLAPGAELDPEIIYTTGPVTVTEGPYTPVECSEWGISGIHRCKSDCPSCYSEIGFKVRWEKSVAVQNTGTVDYTNIVVKANIPTSTYSQNDVALFHPNGSSYPIDVINISAGYINWTIDEIYAGETLIWTIELNTTPPNVTEYNVTEGIEFRKWHDVTGASDLTYENVWDYTYLRDPSIHVKFYDNTTGDMIDIGGYSSWGPPTTKDLNSNGFADFAQWKIPSIPAGTTKRIVIDSTIANVTCTIINKTIVNLPVPAGENVEWKWYILCKNLVDVRISYSVDYRIPLESSRVMLDGNPIEPGFMTVPPYGPYVTISGTLGPYESETRVLEFRTPPVTVDVSPPRFPSRFWVGSRARIMIEITAKNWASEDINQTTKKINIVYGEDAELYEEGILIDTEETIRGYYTLNISNLTQYESRTYQLYYYVPVASATIENYRRVVLNETQYLVYPFKVDALAHFPLDDLYIKFEHEKPFECKDVDFCWEVKEENFYNPREPYKVLDHYCENDRTVVKLSPMSIGESKYYVCFVTESRGEYPDITKAFFDFLEFLINLFKGFIEIITNTIKGLVS